MTTYSKLCPKCSAASDLAATTCKKCGLRFGAPVQAATAQRQSGPAFTGRTAVLAGLIVLIVIFVIVQIVGAAQEKAQRKKDLEYYSWENVQRRANGGQ